MVLFVTEHRGFLKRLVFVFPDYVWADGRRNLSDVKNSPEMNELE